MRGSEGLNPRQALKARRLGLLRLVLAALLLLAASPAAALDGEAALAARLAASGTLRLADGEPVRTATTLERFYRQRGYRLAWQSPELLDALRDAVAASATHGLDPGDYRLARLAQPPADPVERDLLATDSFLLLAAHLLSGRLDAVSIEPDWTAIGRGRDLARHLEGALSSGHIRSWLELLAPPQPEYAALKRALAIERLRLAQSPASERLAEGPVLRAGDSGPRVAALRRVLAARGFAVPDASDPALFDAGLKEAVEAFQRAQRLAVDGLVGASTIAALNADPAERIDRLRVNLERWRWLPEDFGDRHIRVNIAGFALEAWERGRVVRRHQVIVGRNYRKTPVFSGRIRYVILSPWWETPPSLAVKDELPLFRRDPDAIERLGFVVLDADGRPVDTSRIDWNRVPAKGFPFRLRQKPGPSNALGQVKIMFPNPHNVYLHDTPARQLFERSRRDFSSGCVRVQNPLDLATWVLAETPGWGRAAIDRAVAEGQASATDRRVDVARPFGVHILYFTVVADSAGGVRYLDDIYDRDGAVLVALEEAPPGRPDL